MNDATWWATSVTISAIEMQIKHTISCLAELQEFDKKYGDAGQASRDAGRQKAELLLEVLGDALKIRTAAGGR